MSDHDFPSWPVTFLRIAAVCAVAALLIMISACKYTLPVPPSAREMGRRDLMPCEMVPAGYPCQRPVVQEEVTACDKRFGRALCRGEKPRD